MKKDPRGRCGAYSNNTQKSFRGGVQLRFVLSVMGIGRPGFESASAHCRQRRRSFSYMQYTCPRSVVFLACIGGSACVVAVDFT